jgi:hypothetical protein
MTLGVMPHQNIPQCSFVGCCCTCRALCPSHPVPGVTCCAARRLHLMCDWLGPARMSTIANLVVLYRAAALRSRLAAARQQDRFLAFGYGEGLAGHIPEVTARLLQDDRNFAHRIGEDHSLLAEHLWPTTSRCNVTTTADMTVVFDAGQNSGDNFAHLAGTGLHYGGSVPASDCPDLTALAVARTVDQDRSGGMTGCVTCRAIYEARRWAILTHSPKLHAA